MQHRVPDEASESAEQYIGIDICVGLFQRGVVPHTCALVPVVVLIAAVAVITNACLYTI